MRVVDFDPDAYQPHQRVPHWDIGAELGILDLERGAKISGSMFVMFRGLGATLSRAPVPAGARPQRRRLTRRSGRPASCCTRTLTATGQLPKFADDAYHLERDDLWAIPTAEVPLTSVAMDEMLDEAELPKRFMAYSPCFRREAGSAGPRHPRPAARARVRQGRAAGLRHARRRPRPCSTRSWPGPRPPSRDLGLAHRILDICTGDLGQSHHRSFDIEVYAPGVRPVAGGLVGVVVQRLPGPPGQHPLPPDAGDEGARRTNEMVHTLNGSALAVPRVWAALVETHRQPDGSVAVPEVLLPYLRGATVIS